MTDQELAAALETADTELAGIDAKIIECIAGARVHNRNRKVLEEQRDQLRAQVAPLREESAKRVIAAKQALAEKLRAEAEAKAQAAEQSALDKATARIAELEQQLAAKG